jgi:hypothetical protein
MLNVLRLQRVSSSSEPAQIIGASVVVLRNCSRSDFWVCGFGLVEERSDFSLEVDVVIPRQVCVRFSSDTLLVQLDA